MAINNHKRIDNLEEKLSTEQARVKFLEDFSEQLDEKVGKLEGSMEKVKKEIYGQKKSLMTILMIVKLISSHQKESQKYQVNIKAISSGLIQNFVIFGLIQAIIRITFLDEIIENLLGILRFGLSKRTLNRSKFMIKFGFSLTLFFMLKERIKLLLSKLKGILSYLAI